MLFLVKTGKRKRHSIATAYLKAGALSWGVENSHLHFCSEPGTPAGSLTFLVIPSYWLFQGCGLSLGLMFISWKKNQKGFVILAKQKQIGKHQQQIFTKRNSCLLPSPNHKLKVKCIAAKSQSLPFSFNLIGINVWKEPQGVAFLHYTLPL